MKISPVTTGQTASESEGIGHAADRGAANRLCQQAQQRGHYQRNVEVQESGPGQGGPGGRLVFTCNSTTGRTTEAGVNGLRNHTGEMPDVATTMPGTRPDR